MSQPPLNRTMKPQRQPFFGPLALVGACWLWLAVPLGVPAQTTNIVWRAQLSGVLGIQAYRANFDPYMSAAAFKTADFLRMVTGSAPTAGQVLTLNVEMQGGITNLYLGLYDRINRVAVRRLTAGESTLLFQDGHKFAVTADLPVPPTAGTITNITAGVTNITAGVTNISAAVTNIVPGASTLTYGQLRIAGTGRETRGIPSSFLTTVRGFLIEPRTGEGGTTGVLMRATLSAGGVPLKIQPPLLY